MDLPFFALFASLREIFLTLRLKNDGAQRRKGRKGKSRNRESLSLLRLGVSQSFPVWFRFNRVRSYGQWSNIRLIPSACVCARH